MYKKSTANVAFTSTLVAFTAVIVTIFGVLSAGWAIYNVVEAFRSHVALYIVQSFIMLVSSAILFASGLVGILAAFSKRLDLNAAYTGGLFVVLLLNLIAFILNLVVQIHSGKLSSSGGIAASIIINLLLLSICCGIFMGFPVCQRNAIRHEEMQPLTDYYY
eukprot:gb/GECH01009740.1/.p1 GENE.gb/GECH01009740.1/~~gb/GECH01009740.1/.p1  ORF type:complete len:162 (+),score=18.21 gb/GECH01009740.1/:1-486(+)